MSDMDMDTEIGYVPAYRLGTGTLVPISSARIADIDFSVLTEAAVTRHVVTEARAGRGGWIATPNVDICRRASRDPDLAALVGRARLVVPDGMPLVWASRLHGTPLPERVSGSSLIHTLSCAAADAELSIYLLGGAPGVPEMAGAMLARRYPGLRVAGTDAPPPGFERTVAGLSAVHGRIRAARPNIVFVGLGFPKQERVIADLTEIFPRVWFVGCGAAIPFAAGTLDRAPAWLQRSGLEWLFRLAMEPRRLFRRYIIDDLPYAIKLLASSFARRD